MDHSKQSGNYQDLPKFKEKFLFLLTNFLLINQLKIAFNVKNSKYFIKLIWLKFNLIGFKNFEPLSKR